MDENQHYLKAFNRNKYYLHSAISAFFAFAFFVDSLLFNYDDGVISAQSEYLLSWICGLFAIVFLLTQKQEEQKQKVDTNKEVNQIFKAADISTRNLRNRLTEDMLREKQ